MNEYFVVYDQVSGEERWRGQGPAGTAALQELPQGLAAVVVPIEVIASPAIDLGALRAALAVGIDNQAEAVRLRFLTPGAGQALTYQRKETEARAWLADPAAATPFLSAEAAARAVAVSVVAAEVIAMADAWIDIGAAIEALRMASKGAVSSVATLGEIVSAAQVDWEAAVAPFASP